LTVRQTEELVRKLAGEKPAPGVEPAIDPEINAVEQRLMNHFGTKVKIRHSKKGGAITINYYSDEELDAIISLILR
jgi:ParB family chromosome partitioning protein